MMVDRISRSHRSWNMSRIRSSETQPELAVRKLLHQLGYRFRLHDRKLPGVPDIVLPKHRTIVFVHGCYWHQHRGCRYAYKPKSNEAFWEKKFADNVARDRVVARQLRHLGWSVITVWECQTRDLPKLQSRLLRQLARR